MFIKAGFFTLFVLQKFFFSLAIIFFLRYSYSLPAAMRIKLNDTGAYPVYKSVEKYTKYANKNGIITISYLFFKF